MRHSLNEHRDRNIIIVSGAAVALAIIASAGALAATYLSPGDKSTANIQQTKPSENDYIRYTASSDGTAIDQLKSVNDTVVTKDASFGAYVYSINSLSSGTDGKYWGFYVDGQVPKVGASTYEPRGGEVIEWKFQKP